MKKLVLSISLMLLAQGYSLAASATILTFDSLAQGSDNTTIGSTYVEGGYELVDTTAGFGFASWGSSSDYYTGSASIYNADDAGITVLTAANGSQFNLISMDLAQLYPVWGMGGTVTFTGTKDDGAIVTETFTLADSQTGALTFAFSSDFTNLTSVSWANDAPYQQFDNIALASVPEPSGVLMMAGGLTLLWRVKRRKIASRG
jgi:hypothetical protein